MLHDRLVICLLCVFIFLGLKNNFISAVELYWGVYSRSRSKGRLATKMYVCYTSNDGARLPIATSQLVIFTDPKTLNLAQPLDHEPLNLSFDGPDLRGEVAGFICRDAGRDHGTRYSSRPTQGHLTRDIHVGHIFVFTQDG